MNNVFNFNNIKPNTGSTPTNNNPFGGGGGGGATNNNPTNSKHIYFIYNI